MVERGDVFVSPSGRVMYIATKDLWSIATWAVSDAFYNPDGEQFVRMPRWLKDIIVARFRMQFSAAVTL